MNPLRRLFGRTRRYTDIDISIEEHIQERADELEAEGMPRSQAEQTARREFGNVALLQQRSREQWQWPALESVVADLRFTLRRLRKSPGFALTVLLTLAIGIGANTAVFSVIDAVLLKPLPYPASNQLVSLWLNAPGAGGLANFSSGLQLSPSMYFTFSRHNQSFQSMGIWTWSNSNITGLAQPEEVPTALISGGILETLDVPPVLGRWFSAADQDPHGGKTAILGYGYWRRRFGSDPSVIGRTIQVDSQAREIVGVMPRGFRMVDRDVDLLLPLAFDTQKLGMAPFGYDGIARLKPGVTLQQADADVSRLLGVWMDSWSNGPSTNPHYYEKWRITPAFRSLKQLVIGNVSSVLWVVMATVGMVMLIACTNVANLLLVRAESRQQELSIRAALGAGRARIARELLLESLLLGLLGGVLGIAIAYSALRLLLAIGPANMPRATEIALDWRSLCFTFLLSLIAGLLFGSIPAWKYSRSRASLTTAGASRTSSLGRDRQRSRDILVIAQVAMALVLLVSAVLMIRTFAALSHVDPGFIPDHLQTFRISIPESLVKDPLLAARSHNEIADKIASIPGVSSVSYASALPLESFDPNWDLIFVEGKSYQRQEPPLQMFNYVAPGYFNAIGSRILAGRDYTWNDIYAIRNKVIVSENFARENWGSAQAAVGKHIRQFEKNPWSEIIGVVRDVHQHGADENSPAIIYWPVYLNTPYLPTPAPDAVRSVRYAIRTDRAGTQNLINQVQQAVWSVNGNLPVASVETMQEIYSKSMARTSFTLTMLAIAGVMALLLGIIGIYGVIAYAVAQRTREIGIRLALGAQRSKLKWMFVRSALALTVAGIAIGVIAAGVLTQAMRSLLFGISPHDPLTYLAVPLILCAAASIASYLPARRAAGISPTEALRVD
ncbi:ABC transporter permease [Occallatibacter savannae]|uniref:ABC transporter permease n=1 Tax=Occallatibacter savannae TaxID=1002691 RepID=UPI000D690498|nr:ABC transporter permease [Occallatibacter savannae]